MVGGAVLSLQRSETGGSLAQTKASAGNGTGVPSATATLVDVDTQQWRMLDERVLRDTNLDAYLRAHRGSTVVRGRVERVVLER
jgi:hypothetical protein